MQIPKENAMLKPQKSSAAASNPPVLEYPLDGQLAARHSQQRSKSRPAQHGGAGLGLPWGGRGRPAGADYSAGLD
ncbi:MAG: hypothetical protein QM533_13285 [Cytophagales bacterium]|nr:hypothetical protein [Cytophagales bacterium]